MASGSNVTSFHKKKSDALNIPGTRLSCHNAQLLTSTGLSSLDLHLGGGIPVGTIVLIEEDEYQTYAHLLAKYYIAEGIVNGHTIHLASGDVEPQKIIENVPDVITGNFKFPEEPNKNDELKIAWRYRDHKSTEMLPTFGHSYDLSKTMPKELIDKAQITKWNPCADLEQSCSENLVNASYFSLLNSIRSTIDSGGFRTSEKTSSRNILRISVFSIGAPLWGSQSGDKDNEKSLVRFLYMLRSMLRSSFAVALVTVPTIITQNALLLGRLRQMADFVVKLESFVGSDKKCNPMFKDFNGLIHIIKLPILNTFAYQVPPSDLAFKLRRKNFQIELLHLPPDIEDPADDKASSMLCGAPSKLLDF